MFNTLRHLLPSGRAWNLTIDKPLRRFFVGLANGLQVFRQNFDNVADDLYPQSTRLLSEYEEQFGLYPSALTTQQRRARLDAAWKARGGQNPRYIQDTLQAAGFEVYVHDFFYPRNGPEMGGPGIEMGAPGIEMGVDPNAGETRSPFDVLSDSNTGTGYISIAGAETMVSDNPQAVAGATASPKGYLLVNLPTAMDYTIPTDPALWSGIVYVGGPVWGDYAQIPASRKDEFEALCLKIFPLHLWIGVIAEFS